MNASYESLSLEFLSCEFKPTDEDRNWTEPNKPNKPTPNGLNVCSVSSVYIFFFVFIIQTRAERKRRNEKKKYISERNEPKNAKNKRIQWMIRKTNSKILFECEQKQGNRLSLVCVSLPPSFHWLPLLPSLYRSFYIQYLFVFFYLSIIHSMMLSVVGCRLIVIFRHFFTFRFLVYYLVGSLLSKHTRQYTTFARRTFIDGDYCLWSAQNIQKRTTNENRKEKLKGRREGRKTKHMNVRANHKSQIDRYIRIPFIVRWDAVRCGAVLI